MAAYVEKFSEGPPFDTNNFHVFAGSKLGFLKGIDLPSKSFKNVNVSASKGAGIKCMCWGDKVESSIYTSTKSGNCVYYDLNGGRSRKIDIDVEPYGDLIQMTVHNDTLVTACSGGLLKVLNVKMSDCQQPVSIEQLREIHTAKEKQKSNLSCMDLNSALPSQVLTGGKDNLLKVWDLNGSEDPIFTAKNVKNDWLNLQVPIWVTKAEFYPNSNKIITGTGYGKLRLYDPGTPARRPVAEINFGERPLSALSIRPDSDFQVVCGDTIGTVSMADFRNKKTFRKFKGCRGGVTDLKCHTQCSMFVTSSIDRFVNCYDIEKTYPTHSFYVNSSLDCLLFSSKWKPNDDSNSRTSSNQSSAVREDENEEDSFGEVDDEDEEIWKNMVVVGSNSKKRKTAPNEETHESKKLIDKKKKQKKS